MCVFFLARLCVVNFFLFLQRASASGLLTLNLAHWLINCCQHFSTLQMECHPLIRCMHTLYWHIKNGFESQMNWSRHLPQKLCMSANLLSCISIENGYIVCRMVRERLQTTWTKKLLAHCEVRWWLRTMENRCVCVRERERERDTNDINQQFIYKIVHLIQMHWLIKVASINGSTYGSYTTLSHTHTHTHCVHASNNWNAVNFHCACLNIVRY